ncbi:MAG: HD domain-containing protein [Dehalococcoidia bacterium]|jgi:[protein-PII] uridylyltransferase|nr:HD domain-containing protein [Dehalococcoidia bacterium]
MATSHPALALFLETRDDTAPLPETAVGLSRCHTLTDALDQALTQLAAETAGGFAVVAVGGYGRREQVRHSDVDVMLLVPEGGAEQATQLLYPLWDAGLKVGHSVRSIDDAIEAAQNLETFTALLDSRFVAGDRGLYAEYERALHRHVHSQRDWLAAELYHSHSQLIAREPWQLQATDLKTGRGGLRHLQFIHWQLRAEQLADQQPPTETLPNELIEARERILRTRHALHSLTDRPTDAFRDDLAPRIAAWLGEETLDCARALYEAMRLIDRRATERLTAPTEPAHPGWQFWRRKPVEVAVTTEPAPTTDLGALRAALRRAADPNEATALDPLPRAPWLERLLPEWDAIRARRHIAPFHTHPVDTHLFRAVAEAATISDVDEDGSATVRVAEQFGDRDELLLATWLHDVGKGREEEHSTAGAVIAERFCARAGLDAATTQRLTNIVRHHLLLPSVATRRDIADPRVIREVADAVGNAHTLHLLYLVAVADSRATGPDVWTAWKAQLMRSLYTRVHALLEETGSESLDAERAIEAAQQHLAGRFSRELIAEHLSRLEPGYLLSTHPETIGEHLELAAEAAATPAGIAVRHDHLGGMDRVTIVCPDRPGLLQAIAGSLAAHQANVLGGVAYTRGDGVAIDVWHVSDALGHEIDERRWARILETIPAALQGTYPLEERLAQVRATYPAPRSQITPTVHLDNTASDSYSVLEVTAQDRSGLLHAITHVLHELQIDIHLAKVDTLGPEVFDAFYIHRENGRRVEDPDEIERLKRHILAALAALEPEAE